MDTHIVTGTHVLIGVNPFRVLDGTTSAQGYVTLQHLKSERVGNYRAAQTTPMSDEDLAHWEALMHAQNLARTDPSDWRTDAAQALLDAWVENHAFPIGRA